MDFYELARGPLAWVSFIVCIGGMAIRLGITLSRAKKLRRMNPGKSVSGGVKSMVRGMIPFSLQYMRENPMFTLVTFVFHLCLVITPLFLLAHIVLVYESWEIYWVSLPDMTADVMTGIVIAGVIYFAVRRLVQKEVNAVSDFSDWTILVLVAGLFLTGMMAYHHWGPYRPMLIIHTLLGDLLLVMIPFSKLYHMILFFFTRGYLGAEYEIVLDGKGL